ncbi:MAG: hypothetical protein P4L81_00075 [Candidatus Pacebacteria bacterium]|nr:hypothetical protein [Candidatus Paceibacterota bacterium]
MQPRPILAVTLLEWCLWSFGGIVCLSPVWPHAVLCLLLVALAFLLPIYAFWFYAHIWPHRFSKVPGAVPWTPAGSLFQLGILPSFGVARWFGWTGAYSFYGGTRGSSKNDILDAGVVGASNRRDETMKTKRCVRRDLLKPT